MKLLAIFIVVVSSMFMSQKLTAGEVLQINGEAVVVDSGKTIKLARKSQVGWGDVIESAEPGTYLRIKIDDTVIATKGKFKIKLEQPKPQNPRTLNLIYGAVRASVASEKIEKPKFMIKTKTAVAGVRGTDFYLSYLPLLDETEIIGFDGLVSFASTDGKTEQMVNKGQWGGLGGRFGSKINKPLDLPKNVLDHFSGELPIQ